MVTDKRADLSVTVPSVKILCELKHDYHAEVWTATAILGQLERFYTPDPPPGGRSRPKTAAEMEQMLIDLLPQDMRKRIAVIVIDVSGEV
jgi:hypothetical protein